MYLTVNGSTRAFYYENPRPGMLEAGAQRGSLLFSGEAVGETYEGTAYIFNRQCGTFSYRVSGPILDGYRRVVLRGQAPAVDPDCHIIGYRPDLLEFELISTPRPEVASQPQPDALPNKSQTSVQAPLAAPPKESARLREARLLLEDVKAFIADQKTIEHIDEIGGRAAQLQDAIDRSNELDSSLSAKRLTDLMKQSPGFEEFAKQRLEERNRLTERQIAEATDEAKANIYFADKYIIAHIGSGDTKPLLLLRQRLEYAIGSRNLNRLTEANEAAKRFVSEHSQSEQEVENEKMKAPFD